MKLVRKLILGTATLGMTAATLTATTWAWFKINSTATVENFDFEIVSGQGFMTSIDGVHYYNELTHEQIGKSLLVSLGDGNYEISGYDSDGNEQADTVYRISYDSDGNIVKEELSNAEVSNLVQNAFDAIKLLPVTSTDGYSFTDMYSQDVGTAAGKYMQFKAYFKSASDNPDDNQTYDIYLTGYDGKNTAGNDILPTKFTSVITEVGLGASMTAAIPSVTDGIVSKKITTLKSGDKINVYSTNAARIGAAALTPIKVLTSDTELVSNKTYYTYNEEKKKYIRVNEPVVENIATYYEDDYANGTTDSLIYEINDTKNGGYDLGSYATDYTEQAVDGAYSDEYYLYSSECNAMLTYYNKLRSVNVNPLGYDALPNNIIRTLPQKDSSVITKASSVKETGDSNYYPITSVSSGEAAKEITFSIWLEGWDADCFDGLADAIDVRLSFASKRVK